MPKQQITDFKTTAPDSGEIRFLSNTSGEVQGITISAFDCGGNSRIESVANLTSVDIGVVSLNTINGETYSGYFYYEVSPTVSTASLTSYEGVCTTTTLAPSPVVDTFRNSDYNATFNNAIVPRRIERTGSIDANYGGVFEVDGKNSQLTPLNYDTIMSGSAVTASFQESNLYSKSWTLPRYEGSKLTSGSLFYDDPALTFKSFVGAKYGLLDSSSTIRSSSEKPLQEFYFNSPYIRGLGLRDLDGYLQGSTISIPPVGQPIYEKLGSEFKRITRAKIYVNSTEDIIQLTDGLAAFEFNPANNAGVTAGDNIFTVMVETLLAGGDRYFYYDDSGPANLVGGASGIEIRPGTSDIVKVSGSYIASVGAYAIDVASSARSNNLPIFSTLDTSGEKTRFTVISSSLNLT